MSKNDPLVSIIVPVYNAQRYLRETLDSVIAQRFQNFEVLCIDDGSTDSSLTILKEYASTDERFIVLSQKNTGPGIARNNAIKKAKGKYLYFLDSDDVCKPDLLEKSVSCIEIHNADLVVFSFTLYNENIKSELLPDWALINGRYPNDTFTWKDNPDDLFFTFHNFPWNKLFRKSFIIKNEILFQDIFLTEDLLFSGRSLVEARSISCIYQPLIMHREGIPTSAMSTKDYHPFDFIKAFSSFRKVLMQRDDYNELKTAYTRWAASSTIYNLITLHEISSFVNVFDFLHKEGLEEMGLTNLSNSGIINNRDKHAISMIERNKKNELLFYLYSLKHEEEYLTWYRLMLTNKETHELNQKIIELSNAVVSLEDKVNSAEMRVGKVLCKIPRAIQRILLK